MDSLVPANWATSDKIIKVLGVGGGGCNAVNYMFNQGIKGCSFVVCNTDAQALLCSPVPTKIQLGRGLGAGTNPIIGRNAAIESQDQIEKTVLDSFTRMLFITAGMGGGTGTGAAPVIAKMAKDKGILTVAVVTLPFVNEGNEALTRAIDGIHELKKNVDSLILINNQNLHNHFANELIHNAFPKADEVLCTAVRGIVEIIKKPGYINLDFRDIETLMKDSGIALMGCGSGSGENRIDDAVKATFESPLLDNYDLKTAKKVLINITCGKNDKGITMDNLEDINKKIDSYTGNANNFKRGIIWDDDPEITDRVSITAIVTGLRFTDVIGPDRDLGNYIMIDRNYTYVRPDSDPDGIVLHNELSPRQIGPNTRNNVRKFHFAPGEKPCLILNPGDSISDLENEAAIRRKEQ